MWTEPLAQDWDSNTTAGKTWENQPFLAPPWEVNYPDPAESVHVMCPICGKEVKSYAELERRWDGLLVCSADLDPRPRNLKRKRIRAERPKTLNAPGVITFMDDGEGR